MQIYEITHRRMNEAVVPGAVGAMVSTIGSAVTSGLMNKAFAGTGYTAPGATAFSGDRNAAASDYARQHAPALAKQSALGWSQLVASTIADLNKSGTAVTSIGQADAGEQARLKAKLVAMVNQMIGAPDYTKLAHGLSKDPAVVSQGAEVAQNIDNDIEKIFQATVNAGPGTDMGSLFLHLTQDGVLPAQQLLQFNSEQPKVTPGSIATNLTPQAKALATNAGIQDIKKLQTAVQQAGIKSVDDPKLKQILPSLLGISA